MSLRVTLDLSALASGLFLALDRKLVRTNPMLHAEPYINYYVYTITMTDSLDKRKPPESAGLRSAVAVNTRVPELQNS